MPKNTYNDPYLAEECTDEREERAYADVDDLGAFEEYWRDRLAVVRCYIIVCLECQAEFDDLFGVKLKHYKAEFEALLIQAKAATPGTPLFICSVPILRA